MGMGEADSSAVKLMSEARAVRVERRIMGRVLLLGLGGGLLERLNLTEH